MLKQLKVRSLLIGALALFALNSQAIVLKKVEADYKSVENFQRFMEFFNGIEIAGEKLILRTDPSDREGYYWMCDLDTKLTELETGSYAHLEVYVTGVSELQQYTIQLRGLRVEDLDTKKFFFGVTGKDWPDEKAMPIAWRLWIEDPQGNMLTEKKSFVWEMPKTEEQ